MTKSLNPRDNNLGFKLTKMLQQNKVVFDFTQTNSQVEIAIMPASIAQRALRALAEQCSKASPHRIMQDHVNELQHLADNSLNYSAFIAKAQDFVTERQLMDNIQAENWSAYEVKEEEKA